MLFRSDGFNFYYGVLKDTRYKWLDLQQFFALLRPHDDLRAIKFFTSLLEPGPRRSRQETLLQALTTRPLIEVVYGRFKKKNVVCQCRDCPTEDPHTFEGPEEKRTDVNVAIHLLDDAYRGRCEQQILASGDSDLAPAVRMVRQRFPGIRTFCVHPRQDSQSSSGGRVARRRGKTQDDPAGSSCAGPTATHDP